MTDSKLPAVPPSERNLLHYFSRSRITAESKTDTTGSSTFLLGTSESDSAVSTASSKSTQCCTADAGAICESRTDEVREHPELDQSMLKCHSTPIIHVPVDRMTREEYIRRGPVRDFLDDYPKTTIAGKQRSFQAQWFEGRPWLEYIKECDAAFCFACRVFG